MRRGIERGLGERFQSLEHARVLYVTVSVDQQLEQYVDLRSDFLRDLDLRLYWSRRNDVQRLGGVAI